MPTDKFITNFFGDISESIYRHVGKEASKVVFEIHKAFVEGSLYGQNYGTPVDTGNLRASWRSGIRPNSIPRKRDKNKTYSKPKVKFKNYGINYKYYIWNNAVNEKGIPYLDYVNDGIAWNGYHAREEININFVQRTIAKGIQNAKSY